MALCSNRVSLPGSPSICTIDTALMPLPTWIFLLSLPLIFFLSRSSRAAPPAPIVRTRLHKALWIVYLILIVCAIGMTIVELARLGIAKLGVALLPFNTAGLIIAIVIVGCRATMPRLAFPLVHYWLLLVIFEAVKVSRVKLLPSATPTGYPGSDQLLDNAVLLGLYVVFIFLDTYEIAIYWTRLRRTRDALATHPGLSEGSLPLQTSK